MSIRGNSAYSAPNRPVLKRRSRARNVDLKATIQWSQVAEGRQAAHSKANSAGATPKAFMPAWSAEFRGTPGAEGALVFGLGEPMAVQSIDGPWSMKMVMAALAVLSLLMPLIRWAWLENRAAVVNRVGQG